MPKSDGVQPRSGSVVQVARVADASVDELVTSPQRYPVPLRRPLYSTSPARCAVCATCLRASPVLPDIVPAVAPLGSACSSPVATSEPAVPLRWASSIVLLRMTSSDVQISNSLVPKLKQTWERPPTSFWVFLVLNVLGAGISGYGAWLLDASIARWGDPGPGGGLIMLLFVAFPVLACVLIDVIALAMTILATVKRPRFAPTARFIAIMLPWLLAFTLGSFAH